MTNEMIKTSLMFEDIKHLDAEGGEYWEARELMLVLGYIKWENFHKVIKEAMQACKASNYNILEQFPEVRKPLKGGNGNIQYVVDYKLTRYACYLIAQNGDSRKKVIALAQTYFAVQTRKQELSESEYSLLSEDEKRLYKRKQISNGNYLLNIAARNAGVKNFDKFHNSGYKGLYNGETADNIAKRKGLRYREDILDNMCSSELIANEFRIDLANQKIRNEKIKGEKNANKAHYDVGKGVREVIKKFGGTMPEDHPLPKKSIKELEKNNKRKLIH